MTDVRTDTQTAPAKESRGNPQGDFIWYELMTPDPEGAKVFYNAVVGWTIGDGVPEYHGYRMIGRSDGKFAGGILPITDEMRERGARPTWLGYLNVDDVDAKVRAVEAEGGKVLMPPMGIPNVGRTALITDPQGAAFYVMKPTPPADDPNAKSDVFSPTELQRVSWNELNTSDSEAARRFYGEHFGWTSDEFMPMGEMGEYRFWKQNGVQIGAVCGLMGQAKPKWRYYFRVPSIAKAKEAVESGGGSVTHGPVEVPGGDQIIIGLDPQGAEFALVGGA